MLQSDMRCLASTTSHSRSWQLDPTCSRRIDYIMNILHQTWDEDELQWLNEVPRFEKRFIPLGAGPTTSSLQLPERVPNRFEPLVKTPLPSF